MTLTKAEIVKNLHAQTGFSKERCTELVESVFELMKQELENGNDMLISGFGKWSVKGKNPRKGRNPQTGSELMLDGRRVVTFKCSRKLKESVNAAS
ncbi:MAG: integration host factor subunit alpha [Deltaproteobacteria bacterium]|nr:integration host factor subunit alpha [Deltaproteobacteria bacterium]MBN2687996.1 integration host factor subunit alpha [Deltaproteobacteria bacterium]